jgi:flagellin
LVYNIFTKQFIRVKVLFEGGIVMMIDNSIQNSYQRLSSGKRINSAADDPAGLAISQSLKAQSNGLNQGINNGLSGYDAANTADGALGSINDSLQRIRALAVQASNGTLAGGDKQAIQDEINQLKGSISDTAKNTSFNTQKVLDGTFTDKNIATNPQGTGMKMTIQNTSLSSLGIDNFDVTGSFDISNIDNAISKVSDSRSSIGATSNGIMYAADADAIAQSGAQQAGSGIEDQDMAAGVSDLKTQMLLQKIQIYAQKQMMSQKASSINLLG